MEMNIINLLCLILFLLYSLICVYFDIRLRKIPNYVNLSFLFFSLIFFLIFFNFSNWFWILLLFFILLISFFMYQLQIWGGADGKIFIGISLIIMIFDLFFDFVINLSLFYLLGLTILVFIKVPKRSLKKSLKTINYEIILFGILLLFVFISNLINFIVQFIMNFSYYLFSYNINYIFYFILGITILMFLNKSLTAPIRVYYMNLNLEFRIMINIFLFLLFLFFGNSNQYIYFFIVLGLIYFGEFLSIASESLKVNKKIYTTPFSIYLFLAFFLTLILENNFIKILIDIIF